MSHGRLGERRPACGFKDESFDSVRQPARPVFGHHFRYASGFQIIDGGDPPRPVGEQRSTGCQAFGHLVCQRVADIARARRVEVVGDQQRIRTEEHTSELQSLMRISYAVFCLKKKKMKTNIYSNSAENNVQSKITN